MDAITCPFIVAVDSREQKPYKFRTIRSDARQSHRPVRVPVEWATLKQGDYSIQGMEDQVAIERKTLADLYGSVGSGHERFRREAERLASYKYAAVVVEASLETVINRPPPYTKVLPKIPYRTAISWDLRYGLRWYWCGYGASEYINELGRLGQELRALAADWRPEHVKRIRTLGLQAQRMSREADKEIAKESRKLAELTCFRLLSNFWELHHDASEN